MCRLFGFRSAVLSRAHRSLIEAENALSHQATHHPDGWGLGWFHAGEPYLIKSERGAAGSASFRRASESLASHTMVVHVRRATVGDLSPFNVHPFRHGRWVFAHNGTLFSFDVLGPRLRAEMGPDLGPRVLGTTDSETLFFWLLSRLEEAGLDPLGNVEPGVEAVREVLQAAHARLRAHADAVGAEPPVVNYLLTNGTTFCAQRFGRDLFLASQKIRCRDARICPWPDKVCLEADRPTDGRVNHLLVASERIGDEDRWEAVPDATLLVLGADFRLVTAPLPGGGHVRGDCPGCRLPDRYAFRDVAELG